jgi:hypothetical protein
MARPQCDTPLCCFASLCFLCVHDAEELKLSLLSTLQKQTNKQTTPTGSCMDLPSMKYYKSSSLKLTPHKTKWCLKKIYYSHRVFVLMREIAQKLTDLHARVFNHFFLFIYLFLNFQSLFSPALWYLFFLTT